MVESHIAGVRKQGSTTPAELTDKFHLGSCTKAMTATLCGILVDRGLLRWTTTIFEIFPNLDADPAFKIITLDHLLSQTSGLSSESWPKTRSFVEWHEMKGTPRDRRKVYLHDTLKIAPNKPVGAKFEYSNTNFALAGILAETVTDTPYEDLLHQEIFAKLGMDSAGFGHPADPKMTDHPDQPWPHTLKAGKVSVITPGPLSDNPDVITPAGRVHCSIEDWAKFVDVERRHMNGEHVLVSPDTASHLHSMPPVGNYMGGWILVERPWAGGMAYNHAGSNTVNFCVAWVAPKKNFVSLVMTNIGGDEVFPTLDGVIAASIQKHL